MKTETWGGEIDLNESLSTYGVTIENVQIGGIDPKDFSNLAVTMINHLILNDHQFEIVKNEMGVRQIKEI